MLRRLKISDALKGATEMLRAGSEWRGVDAGGWGDRTLGQVWGEAITTEERRPTRAGRTPTYYAIWAARYVDFAGSPKPAKEMAARYGIAVKRAHQVVFRARELGLLTGGHQGKPGGQLSTSAKDLLRALEAPIDKGTKR